MSSERRKLYRTTARDEEGVEVTVKTEAGETLCGPILDLTIEGLGASFPREGGAQLAVGESVSLTIAWTRLRWPLKVPAQVRSRSEMWAFRRYGFQFDKNAELEKHLAEDLREFLNKRRTHRVTPDPEAPVEVLLEAGPDAAPELAPASLQDISAVGMGVLLDRGAERAFSKVELLRTCFRLPPSDEPLELVAWIRNRRLEGEKVCYGLEFDPTLTPDFQPRQQAIVRYVLRRERGHKLIPR